MVAAEHLDFLIVIFIWENLHVNIHEGNMYGGID